MGLVCVFYEGQHRHPPARAAARARPFVAVLHIVHIRKVAMLAWYLKRGRDSNQSDFDVNIGSGACFLLDASRASHRARRGVRALPFGVV